MNYRPPAWQSNAGKQEVGVLIGLGFISIVLWGSPWGSYLLYPFSILATWFHEMGHGLAAMLFGHDFQRLVIFPDGSGYALHVSEGEPSRIAMAAIAAAGLLGPTFAGCLLILASRTHKATTIALALLGTALLLSTGIWVRSATGWIILPAMGAICLALAYFAREKHRRFAVQFLGVQGCISIYRDFGYIFSPGGFIDGRAQPSDTQFIAEALILPYWFWGSLITVMIGAMVIWSLKRAHSG